MPVDFPDMESLKRAAEGWKFRQPDEGETEESYRNALANFVAPRDIVESQEIRHKVGWDKWTDEQSKDLLFQVSIQGFSKH